MPNELTFPLLYKTTKTGAIQTYTVRVDEDIITVTQGQLEGKKQSYTTTCMPKNVGRSNETTGHQQAALEANAKITKKLKAGYSTSIEQPSELLLPMKVKTYQSQLHNIPEHVYESPKLNGVNGEFRLVNKKLVLLSRGGNEYPMLEHLQVPITKLLTKLNTTSIAGELYIHGEFLQDITGAVKKFKQHITPRIEFHVFDLPVMGHTRSIRVEYMDKHIGNQYSNNSIFLIPSVFIHRDNIVANHKIQVDEGYEGTVLYHPDGEYQYNIRSSYVWKYKLAQDAEFKIVSHIRDKSGHPVFICEANNKAKSHFAVKPKGTAAERLAIQADAWHEQWMKVEFEMLSKDGKPQKPVGIGLRACNNKGEPLE